MLFSVSPKLFDFLLERSWISVSCKFINISFFYIHYFECLCVFLIKSTELQHLEYKCSVRAVYIHSGTQILGQFRIYLNRKCFIYRTFFFYHVFFFFFVMSLTGLHKQSKCKLRESVWWVCVQKWAGILFFSLKNQFRFSFRIAKCGTDQQNTACLQQLHRPTTTLTYPFYTLKKPQAKVSMLQFSMSKVNLKM